MELATNLFKHGLQMDTHPMVLGNDSLTDALNATLVTMNGNEVILLNDMGNRRVDNAFLPAGYEPVGMKEYGGIIYVAAYNPITNRSQVGSFPSPERKLSASDFNGEDLKAEFNFDDKFYGSNNIEHDDDYNLDFLKNDSFLIPLTKDLNLHVGDKFTVYAAGLSNMKDRITNYENTITVDGKNWVLTPKNKEFTLQLGILNSQNEFVDITKSLTRWNGKSYINEKLVFEDEESEKIVNVDDGATIQIYISSTNSDSYLQYSIDEGITWHYITNSSEAIDIEGSYRLILKGKNTVVTNIRNKKWDIIDYTNESELYKFNDGYFIPDEFTNPNLDLSKKDAELIKERQTIATNTYAYKLVGPLYLKVTLNHILSCDYNIDISIDEDLNIILTNSSILYYNCPDGTATNMEYNPIGEYYTKDIPNLDEVTLKLDIYLNDFVTTDAIEDYTHTLELLLGNLTLIESSQNDYYNIYRDLSGNFSEDELIIKAFVLEKHLPKSSLLIYTRKKELNEVKLKWGEDLYHLENEIEANFVLISKFYNFDGGEIVDNYIYSVKLKDILDTNLFINENNIYSEIVIKSTLGLIKAIWFYPYYNFTNVFDSFLDDEENAIKCFDNFKGNKYLLSTSALAENEILLYNSNGEYTSIYNLEIIDYNLEIDPKITKIIYFPENIGESYLLLFKYIYFNFSLYRVKTNSFTYKHTLEFNVDNCYEFLLKASSILELTSIKAFINELESLEILKENDNKLLYSPPTYITNFLFKINSNVRKVTIEYYSDSEKEFLQIFPRLKNSLSLISSNISNIIYNQGIYQAKLNDIYKINYNSLNINLNIGTLFKNINGTNVYLKGCSEKLNINTEYINKNVVEIVDWRTNYEDNKILFIFGIQNYTGQNIENIKIYFESYDGTHNYIYKINKIFDLYNTVNVNIDIDNNNESSLKPNNIYKVNKITYNIVGLSNEQELVEYLKLIDNLSLYDLDMNGNKKLLLRWIITTDLFNEFYSLNKILDYCTLYNSSIELRLKFLEKMNVNFNFKQLERVNINVSETVSNQGNPYNYTVSTITFENYPTIDDTTIDDSLFFLKNYPKEVINIFREKLRNETMIEIDKNYVNIGDNYYAINNRAIYYYDTISSNTVDTIVELGNNNENLKNSLKLKTFMHCYGIGPGRFLEIYLYYLGNHLLGSSTVINQYFDSPGEMWKTLSSSGTNQYAVLIPDTHESGSDDLHYLVTYLNNSLFGEIKSYDDLGKNNYNYLDAQSFRKYQDEPYTFYYSDAQQQFSDYLYRTLPRHQICTNMYIKGLKAYKNINGDYRNHFWFEPNGPCISFIKDKNDKWYISNNGSVPFLKNDYNVYYCSHMESGEGLQSIYYKSDANYIYTIPFKCKLLVKIRINFSSKEILSYGNLNFKLNNYIYYNYLDILLKNGNNTVEEIGHGLYNEVNYNGQVIKLYIKVNGNYELLNNGELDTSKMYYINNDNCRVVKNFYVYNDENHKINGINTFVYSFPEELTSETDRVQIEGNLYDGVEYCNDYDSITRLHFAGMVRNSAIEY